MVNFLYDVCFVIIILILLIPLAGVFIISTLMYNVKPEALTGDIDKTKIKAVTGDKDENPNVKKVVFNSGDSYLAYAGAYADVSYNNELDHQSLPLTQKKFSEVKTVNKPRMLKPNVPMVKYITTWTNISLKSTALKTSILALFVSLVLFAFFDFTNNQFQFVQEYHEVNTFSFYLGVDGLSIYFVLLTTIIMPIALLSN